MTVDASDLLAGLDRFALERVTALGEEFVATARQHASRRTGAMAESVEADDAQASSGGASVTVTCAAEYGRWQDEGTGIYGPNGTRIYPTHAQVLVFDWPSAGGIVFARSVAGSEPTRWWQRTLDDWPRIVASVGS